MDKKKWEKEYPQMPEAFHLAVKEAVERKNEKHIPSYKKAKRRYTLLLAAVLMTGILAVVGVTAGQKEKDPMVNFIERMGLESRKDVAAVLQEEVKVKVEKSPAYPEGMDEELLHSLKKRDNNEPLLSVEGVMYDGMSLAVLALPTKNGRKYSCESWNFRINGEDIGPTSMENNMGKEDFYIFSACVDSLNLKAPFDVTIPLKNYRKGKRYENQDLTLTVEIDGEIQSLPEQEFVCEDYTVKVTDLKKSFTALSGKVVVEMTDEQKEAYAGGDTQIVDILLRGSDGTIWKDSLSGENWNEEGREKVSEDIYSKSFYIRIPADDQEKVILSLMGCPKDSLEEEYDSWNLDNRFGEDMHLSMKEKGEMKK